MDRLFSALYAPIFRRAGVGLVSPSGITLVPATEDGPSVKFSRRRDLLRLLLSPELSFAEAFADGHLTIINGRIYDVLLKFAMDSSEKSSVFIIAKSLQKITAPFFRFAQGISPRKSTKNVHAHYDLGNEFYQLFLDEDLQYSCAYFTDPDQDLATAQQQKKDHIIRKLLCADGMTALDIGCGWGGLSLDIAKHGVKVTGLTLSQEQFELAQKRQQDSGMDVEIKFQDYRHETATYDRVVSVGMFEHVGPLQFQRYFDQVAANLNDQGVALIHTIGRHSPPTMVNKFTRKYIFPGGYIPSLSQIMTAVEQTGLLVTDIEFLYLHYAETLRHWRQNFLTTRAKVVEMYDERFANIWEFYLAGSEAAFRSKQITVFQLQLKKTTTPVELTRDYLYR